MRKLLGWSLLALLAACASPAQGGSTAPDTVEQVDDATGDGASGIDFISVSDSKADTLAADGAKSDGTPGDGAPVDVAGGSFVWLTFDVDDSANQTFGDGDIRWTGSFTWDSTTNAVTYATSWLPTDGPFPPLYDDGPLSKGGHEREGATAGDHIFSTAVKFSTDADTTFEYGALNELDHWMWVGPNGKFTVQKGAAGTIAVPGMALKKFGPVDLKLVLDTKALAAAFSKWSIVNNKFFVKGSMNQWTPVQLLDDGKKGDDAAGDGKLTFVLKQNLGKHDGGVSVGDEVQFIFVATTGDALPEDGQEYKGATQAQTEGVAAWDDTGTGWTSAAVELKKDSKGKFLNTAITIAAPASGCAPACKATETCVNSQCVANPVSLSLASVAPANGPSSGGTKLPITGAGSALGAKTTLDGTECTPVSILPDGTTLTCKTPAHVPGKVDVTVTNPDTKAKTLVGAFTYDELPPATILLTSNLVGTATDAASFTALTAIAKVPTISQAPGQTPGLGVEFGWGPAGSNPITDKTWQWVAGTYVSDDTLGKGEETYSGAFPVLPVGKYGFTARVIWQGLTTYGDADGSENGVDVAKLGTLTVVPKPAGVPTLTGITPTWAAAKGGSVITLLGENLQPAFPIAFVSTMPQKTAVVGINAFAVTGGVSVTVPALPPMPADVSIAPPNVAALKLPAALEMVPFDTPTVDGTVGSDWNPFSMAAMNVVGTSWGAGLNEINNVYASFDSQNVYFGIQGTCEAANAIVVYIDPNYGSAADTAPLSILTDNTGAVDDAISSVLTKTDAAFGAHFAFASIGMQSYPGGDLSLSTGAGWRNLDTPTNFSWLDGPVIASTDAPGIEASLPLSVLYPGGVPSKGATLAFVVVLMSKDGSVISNQAVPFQAGAADEKTLTSFSKLRVFGPAAAP